MPAAARATPRAGSTNGAPALVAVLAPGQSALAVLDGRTPGFTPEQVEEATKRLAEESGPVVALVRQRSEESWAKVRSELNQIAGEASAKTMIHAHHALLAHEALVMQRLAAGKAYGTGDDLAEKHMRNAAGLAVVASDALNKAYESAREDAKAREKGGPVAVLMNRIGAPDVRPEPPISTPGVVSSGAPPSETAPPKPEVPE